jgi:hypothetical protein
VPESHAKETEQAQSRSCPNQGRETAEASGQAEGQGKTQMSHGDRKQESGFMESLVSEIAGPREEPRMQNPPKNPDERPTEDDIQREKLGPRGVQGEPDPAKMTP